LVNASHTEKVSDLIAAFNKSFTGLADNAKTLTGPFDDRLPQAPNERRVLRSESKHNSDFSKLLDSRQLNRHHTSDSGIGSSISDEDSIDISTQTRLRNGMPITAPSTITANSTQAAGSSVYSSAQTASSVYSTINSGHSAITRSFSALGSAQGGHCLSDKVLKQINEHIIEPILAEDKFKEYHPLVKEIPKRIKDRTIDCLRDLEKTVVFVTPVSADFSAGEGVLAYCFLLVKEKSSSAASYFRFCEFSIQCIHTAVTHLGGRDLCRPTDRPYTNTYFLDLHQQIQHYARIIAEARQKQSEGKKLQDMDYSPSVFSIIESYSTLPLTHHSGEKLQLRGGLSKNGKPLELVREKDGKILSMTGAELGPEEPGQGEMLDEETLRSMGRKRKCDIGKEVYRACRECGKEFKRPCDLTKHEKTHSRPWKCSQTDCKYHEHGWPTEKERDRHVNDKHSAAPSLFKCLYKPCPYSSKRESNCKQHMEKAHGWDYVRSKSKKGQHLIPTQATPTLSMMPTPSSGTAFAPLSTPRTPLSDFSSENNMDTFTSVGSESPNTSEFIQSLQGVQSHSPWDVPDAPLFPEEPTFAGQQQMFDFGTGSSELVSNDAQLFPELAQNNVEFNWSSEAFSNSSWMNVQGTNQQLTPPWSTADMDFSKFNSLLPNTEMMQHNIHLTPNAQPDDLFASITPEDEGFADGDYSMGKGDFPLFGGDLDNSMYGGESSAMGALFNHNGNFEPQYEDSSLYDTTGTRFTVDNSIFLDGSNVDHYEDL